ncbi:hypothetical protein GIB67_020845 [Kingdonia uniflora]|uniref:3,4-dihydroxy-2-butanone kinase n=1 Tax=Kingdonia uniflora TaxID=39325 RepID=A0A7J7M7D7_9MAGN|nr:hypothetical protein GIB67_020845 [Kingdonia uniflora]
MFECCESFSNGLKFENIGVDPAPNNLNLGTIRHTFVFLDTGGGSGHEPAHAGFVGEGMLTAAICGDIFTSPPVDSILAGIRAVTGTKGCLLIVKNYTGDRLNFGLAAEKAKAEGYKVEMVIVGDDCALPPLRGITGRRGLAGTILVHKVAGAAAAAGLSLADVTTEAKKASELVGTMGVALSVCTLPGQVTSDRVGTGKMEIGLGIHGEPGAAVVDLQSVDIMVSHVLSQILSLETQYVPITRGSRVVLMTNGLGATPLMELMIATGKIVPKLQVEHGLAVDRVYTGSFMTSLDMAGFSISIMKADPEILHRLDAPTQAPYWPVGVSGARPLAKIPVPVPRSSSRKTDEMGNVYLVQPPCPPTDENLMERLTMIVGGSVKNITAELSRPQHLTVQACLLEAAIEAAANAVINNKDALNDYDSKVGDGDCGTTMCRGAQAILNDIKNYYPLNDAAETVNEIGASISRVMGGTSGIMYNIFCAAAYAKLKDNTNSVVTCKQWADALDTAISKISKYGGALKGYRTMLDALIPAASVLRWELDSGADPISAFVLSSEAASNGAKSTQQMQAQAGRSTYVRAEILTSVPDPGAMAVAAWYSAAALALKEKMGEMGHKS